MITIEADFNHLDGQGRLILSDLVIHGQTPFEVLAASGKRILFIQGEDVVFGRLAQDPTLGGAVRRTGTPRRCLRSTRARRSPGRAERLGFRGVLVRARAVDRPRAVAVVCDDARLHMTIADGRVVSVRPSNGARAGHPRTGAPEHRRLQQAVR